MSYYENPDNCRQLCELAHQYLHGLVYRAIFELNKGEVSHQEVDQFLEAYKRSKIDVVTDEEKRLPLNDLYQHFLNHAQNKSTGGPAIRAVIGSLWYEAYKERWTKLALVLGKFEPKNFTYTSRDELRNAILGEYKLQEFTGPVEDYITTIFRLGCWFRECVDNEVNIYDYFASLYKEPESLISTLLKTTSDGQKVFFGFGDALLRDALKELGYLNFVKADVHVIDIARGVGIVGENESNTTTIAQEVAKVALILKDPSWTPYRLDKLFFLIGSGGLAHPELDLSKYFSKRNSGARKEGFIDFVKERQNAPKIDSGVEVALLRSQSNLIRGKRGKVLSVDAETWLVKVDFGSIADEIYISDLMVLH